MGGQGAVWEGLIEERWGVRGAYRYHPVLNNSSSTILSELDNASET